MLVHLNLPTLQRSDKANMCLDTSINIRLTYGHNTELKPVIYNNNHYLFCDHSYAHRHVSVHLVSCQMWSRDTLHSAITRKAGVESNPRLNASFSCMMYKPCA